MAVSRAGFPSSAFLGEVAAALGVPPGHGGGEGAWRVGYGRDGAAPALHVQAFREGRLVGWYRADEGPQPDVVVRRPAAVDYGDFAGTMAADDILAATTIAVVRPGRSGTRVMPGPPAGYDGGTNADGEGAAGTPGTEATDLLGLGLAVTHRGLDCAGDAVVATFRLTSSPFGTADVTIEVAGGRCRRWHTGAPAAPDLWARCPIGDFVAWLHGGGLAGPLLVRSELRGGVELVSYLQGALWRGDDEPPALGRTVTAYLQARQANAPLIDALMDELS